jgi:hypothetical protein
MTDCQREGGVHDEQTIIEAMHFLQPDAMLGFETADNAPVSPAIGRLR